jgi:hypothetical protein
LISGCAITQPVKNEDQQGSYIGYSDGKYVRLYYRIEDSVLTLTVENRSILPLYKVIFSVEQKTTAGSIEGQSTLRLLRKSGFHTMNFNIPANSTGEVVFTCYFETDAPDPDTFLKEYLDDRIIIFLSK